MPDLAEAAVTAPVPDLRVAAHVLDVFVYVVVLNVFVEYFPGVITETFTLSLLTAVLLKVVLEVVVLAKNHMKRWFEAAASLPGKVAVGLAVWLLLLGSKLVVLELVDLVFGDRVSLGSFISVTALIVVLMVARGMVRGLVAARPADPHL